MKTIAKSFFLLCFGFLWLSSYAQQTSKTLHFDGLNRYYIQYIPMIYDSSESTPVVFWFHRLGWTQTEFQYLDWDLVADTANFIIISPLARLDPMINETAWNAGMGSGWSPNASVDDVGFILAILDTLSSEVNIDFDRIYAGGYGTGGFFTNRIACEHPEIFEAVASVNGTIGSGIECNPSESIRVAQFHGTEYTFAGYYGSTFGMSVPEWLDFWQSANGCNNELITGPLPDTQNDGLTIDYFRYANCNENAEVVHYRVNGNNGSWLTANNDLSYTTEIWRFFLGVHPQLVSGVYNNNESYLHVFPNPASTSITIELPANTSSISTIELIDLTGRVYKMDISRMNDFAILDLNGLSTGTYTVRVVTENYTLASRIVIQ